VLHVFKNILHVFIYLLFTLSCFEGTGKSKTGARIAYLLAASSEKVLFCGPTNTAVDTVASQWLVCFACFT